MRALFIGGTGNISSAVSRLAVTRGIELHHLNRGRAAAIEGVHTWACDISNADAAARVLAGQQWDIVVNWIAFKPADIERDLELFRGRTRQYIFISSASVYQKPPTHPVVTESTPLANPYWDYSRNKIACEERLMRAFRDEAFPMVIVRPSLTYDTVIPLAIGGWNDYSIIERMKQGRPVVVHGDGTSLWTITHADDFARGFVGLMGLPQAEGHAFHITSDELLNWNQIYQAVAAAAGAEAKLVHVPSETIANVAEQVGQPWVRGGLLGDKSWSLIFDNSKIKRFVPEFQATIPFAQGIRRTLAWFAAEPSRRVIQKRGDELIDAIIQRAAALQRSEQPKEK